MQSEGFTKQSGEFTMGNLRSTKGFWEDGVKLILPKRFLNCASTN